MANPVWTVYKTTHLPSGKFYIGVHKTADPNDRYLGSGKIISRAIRAHGRQEFSKEVLFVFASPEEAYAKEAELVNDAFVARADTYNLQRGGTIIKQGREGKANSQHGTVWISKGLTEKKVRQEDEPVYLLDGWVRGRARLASVPRQPKIRLFKDGHSKRVPLVDQDRHLAEGWSTTRGKGRGVPRPRELRRGYARGERAGGSKLTETEVALVQRLYAAGGETTRTLGRRFGVSHTAISLLLRGATWNKEGNAA